MIITHPFPHEIGTTAERTATTLDGAMQGATFWDTTLGSLFVWSGTAWIAVGGSSIFDNPTASVGPTVVNGSATTAMRSDAAPPINLTANYDWTGTHTFNNTIDILAANELHFRGILGMRSPTAGLLRIGEGFGTCDFFDSSGIALQYTSAIVEIKGTRDFNVLGGTLKMAGIDTITTGGAATFTSVTDSGLTSGRVALVSTGGLLIDDAGLLYDVGTDALTVAGEVYLLGETEWGVGRRLQFPGIINVTPEENFLTGMGPLTTWAGSPFGTPTNDFTTTPSNLHVTDTANARSFAYETVSVGTGASKQLRVRVDARNGVERAGLRLDDGSDTNYWEIAVRTQSLTGTCEIITIVSGTVTVRATGLPRGYYTLLLNMNTTNFFAYYTSNGYDVSFLATAASTRVWTATRAGIIYTQGASTNTGFTAEFDWYNSN